MKILIEKPPNYKEISKCFDIEDKPVVFTYGDILYNPKDGHIRNDLMIHELTHQKQQGADPKKWWKKYLTDKDFRLQQEVEAYQNQYGFLAKIIKNREMLFKYLHKFSHDLSSPIYGNMINYQEAMKTIKTP